MKNWLLNFLRDERGAESVEFGTTAIIVGAGAVAGTDGLQDVLKDKMDDTTARIGTADV